MNDPTEKTQSSSRDGHPYGGDEDPFLYALAKHPSHYTPLNHEDHAVLEAWYKGTASAEDIDRARLAVRTNLAARELLLSMQLELAASTAPDVPKHVTRAILGSATSGNGWSIPHLLHLPSLKRWQYGSFAAVVAAALILMVDLKPVDQETGRLAYKVAALSDRTILGAYGGAVTRGLAARRNTVMLERLREASEPVFIEVDVPTSLLRALFDASPPTGAKPGDPAVAAAARSLLQLTGEPLPSLIFDQDLEAFVRSGKAGDIVVVLVYDLTNAQNEVIAKDLRAPKDRQALFITFAP